MSSRQAKEPIPLTRKKRPSGPPDRKSNPHLVAVAPVQRSGAVTLPRVRLIARGGTAHRRPATVPPRPASTPRLQQPAEPRAFPHWPILVHISFESAHNFYCGFFREPATSGLFVATYSVVPLGELMLINFTVPSHRGPVSALCEARWIREYNSRTWDLHPGIGFGFVRIDAEALDAVARFMGHREPVFWEG